MDMTPCMVAIYDGVQDLLDACIKDLKRTNKVRYEMSPLFMAFPSFLPGNTLLWGLLFRPT